MISRTIKYIDMHAHILPGIDDGAESYDEALHMAGIAYEENIRLIVATPHYGIMNPGFSRLKTEEVYGELRRKIKEKYPDMGLALGNEVFYSGSTMIDDLEKGKALTMAGTDYVLIEFSPLDPAGKIEAGIRDMAMAGLRPILAHAERYEALYKDLYLIEDLIEAGATIQINSRSLTRGRLDKRGSWARKLVKEGLVHIIASDCHNDKGRSPLMLEAVSKIETIADEDELIRITVDNPRRILENKFL